MSNNTRFEKARFHIAYGPKALFDRVLFKLKDVNQLKLSADHFVFRLKTRHIPSEVIKRIKQFNMNDWKLVCCEVRIDKGKFVNSTWETVFEGMRYWITGPMSILWTHRYRTFYE